MELIGFWLLCGVVAAVIVSNKGGGAIAGFFVGALLGPLGIIISLFMGNDAAKADKLVASGQMKKCPMCAELVQAEAVICKHCRHDFYAEFKDEEQSPTAA